MQARPLRLSVDTKLPIAMVGRQIIRAMGEGLRTTSGSLALFAAILRASSFVRSLAGRLYSTKEPSGRYAFTRTLACGRLRLRLTSRVTRVAHSLAARSCKKINGHSAATFLNSQSHDEPQRKQVRVDLDQWLSLNRT